MLAYLAVRVSLDDDLTDEVVEHLIYPYLQTNCQPISCLIVKHVH